MLQERPLLEFPECLPKLFLRVHHNRAVPRHRLLDGLARYQQKSDALRARLHHNLIAAVKEHQRVVARSDIVLSFYRQGAAGTRIWRYT